MASKWIWILISLVLTVVHVTAEEVQDSARTNLVRSLMENYEKNYGSIVIPSRGGNDTTKVKFGVSLIRGTLDEETRTYTADIWFRYTWIDRRLSWNPAKYDGLNTLHIPAKLLWRPDIVLFTSIDTLEMDYNLNAIIYPDGTVLWIPPTRIKTDCSYNGTYYQCDYKFGSWTFDGFMMDVNFYNDEAAVDLNDYITSKKYKIISHGAVRNVKRYACCVEPYIDLTYTLVLESPQGWWSWNKHHKMYTGLTKNVQFIVKQTTVTRQSNGVS